MSAKRFSKALVLAVVEDCAGDPCAATRLAITRAAAHLGRAMP